MASATTPNVFVPLDGRAMNAKSMPLAKTNVPGTGCVFWTNACVKLGTVRTTALPWTKPLLKQNVREAATIEVLVNLANVFAILVLGVPIVKTAWITNAPKRKVSRARATGNVCTTNVFACLVLTAKRVKKKPNAPTIVRATVLVRTACVTANHPTVVPIAIPHWPAKTIAIRAAFVWMASVPASRVSKGIPAVLAPTCAPTNVPGTVPVKLVVAFVTRPGRARGVRNTAPNVARTIVRPVACATTANAFVNPA